MQHSVPYTILFAGLICVVCAVLVSSSAVSLKEMQQANAALDKRKNVLLSAGLAQPTDELDAARFRNCFGTVKQVVIDLQSGEAVPDIDPSTFDQRKARNDPDSSREAPPNNSSISRLPNQAVVYQVLNDSGELQMVVAAHRGIRTLVHPLRLPVPGRRYQDGAGAHLLPTRRDPGTGGEVDNPRWKARWPGRIAFDSAGQTVIEVIKGQAGPPEEDPHRVDGLAGATITSRGVTNMLRFWLGENGFGPFLKRLRDTRKSS